MLDEAYVSFFGAFRAAWDDATVGRWSANHSSGNRIRSRQRSRPNPVNLFPRVAGFAAVGWDLDDNADAPLAPADCVNFGYVLNGIEAPAGRRIALRRAWPCLTLARRGNVPELFLQDEARTLIESELGCKATTVGAGLFWSSETSCSSKAACSSGSVVVPRSPGACGHRRASAP